MLDFTILILVTEKEPVYGPIKEGLAVGWVEKTVRPSNFFHQLGGKEKLANFFS